MAKPILSTKPDELGTFGRPRTNCVFDGTAMRPYGDELPLTPPNETPKIVQENMRCPLCGWITSFIKTKE